MPLYDFACPECGLQEERLARFDAQVACPRGHWMARQFPTPAAVPPELTPYYDHGIGTWITSRAERRAHMRAKGLVEVGSTHLHGARGLLVSAPGLVARSVPKSGAYAPSAPPRQSQNG